MPIKGFFSTTELEKQSYFDIQRNKSAFPACKKCKLDQKCKNPKIAYTGEGKKKILIIDEYPHEAEDMTGEPLSRAIADDFKDTLYNQGIDVDKDCWATHAVACHAQTDKKAKQAILNCKPLINSVIQKLKPKYIVLLGQISIESFYAGIFKKSTEDLFRGSKFADRQHNAWVLPLQSLSVFNNHWEKNTQSVFNRDLKRITKFIKSKKEFPKFGNDEEKVKCLYRYEEVIGLLNKIIKNPPKYLAFDYETNSLKPFRPGSKIASISLSFSKTIAYSFPLDYRDYWTPGQLKIIKKKWQHILTCKKTKKTAHNFKFEDVWTNVILNHPVKNWYLCTMNFAHIMDNRKYSTTLDFQTYLNFGRYPYNGKVKRYLMSETHFNKVDECPLEDLLLYGGLDSLYNFWLLCKQNKVLKRKPKLANAYKLFHAGLKEFSLIQQTGIVTDEEYYHKIDKKLTKKIKKLNQQLVESKEAKVFRKKFKRNIDFNSGKDLGILLYDILKSKPRYTSPTSKTYSTDEESLIKSKQPIVKKLIRTRKLTKIKNTYLAQFIRESYNGRMHPFLDLHIPVSFRGSSSKPNSQNIPTRFELAKKYCRSGIKPSQGNKLLEWDFSSIEVGSGCCYHYDPVMINYVTDKDTDMHRDCAMDIWQLSEDQVSDKIRFFAKNGWTFPQFYGMKYKNCAVNLWETCINLSTEDGILLRDHMRSLSIKNLKQFTDYLYEAEDIFWNKRFIVYRDWKKDINDFYIRKGYIETHLGFRMTGIMGPNDTTNYQIQGCLQGKSLVLTKKGYIPIKELVGKTVKVWTGFKWKEAVGLNRGKCQLARIHLNSGLVINCDTRHKLKNEHNKWVDFKDLKIGTYVALPKLEKKKKHTHKINWQFVLGFIIGDGSFRSRKISEGFTRYELDICGGQTKIKQLIEIKAFLEKEGFKPRYRTKISKNPNVKDRYVLTIEGKKLFFKLKKFGLLPGLNAHTKKIPKSIWKMSSSMKRDFLWGIWLSDGARRKEANRFLHMCNKKLLKEIQILSSSVGYDTYLKRTKDGHLLRFMSINREYRTSRKFPKSTFKRAIKGTTIPKYNPNNNETITDRRTYTSEENVNHLLAERVINQINPDFEFYRYDTIKNITILKEEADTYTMSVDDPLHQFVADGVIHKNTAFHILLHTLIKVAKIGRKKNWLTKFITQIHDSGLQDLYPPEQKKIITTVNRIVSKDIPKEFPWINVPLKVDFEITPINGSWYEKEKLQITV